MQKRKIFLAMLFSMLWLTGFAQNDVTGVVKDGTGEPLIGVSVMIKGSTTGTVTDFDGNFTMKSVPSSAQLQFSYIGFQTQVVNVGNTTNFNITLLEDNTTLEDVVVIGYGTMKRKDLTGSVSSVTGDKLAAVPVSTVSEALQGKLSGVNVTAQDGRPGAAMTIRVRGGGSITQSNDPLFIVDGVAVSSIDDIPADNIESIDVLKDASSTAIYGARGANGVILITTKGYYYVRDRWEYMQAVGYGDNMARYYGLGAENGNHLNDYKNVSSHNYMDDVFQGGHMWNHDLSVSGGTDKTKYFTSVNYTKDASTMKNSGFNRWNISLKLQQKIASSLKLDVEARYNETATTQNRFFNGSSANINNTLVYPWMFNPIDGPLGNAATTEFGEGNIFAEPQYNPIAGQVQILVVISLHRPSWLRAMATAPHGQPL